MFLQNYTKEELGSLCLLRQNDNLRQHLGYNIDAEFKQFREIKKLIEKGADKNTIFSKIFKNSEEASFFVKIWNGSSDDRIEKKLSKKDTNINNILEDVEKIIKEIHSLCREHLLKKQMHKGVIYIRSFTLKDFNILCERYNLGSGESLEKILENKEKLKSLISNEMQIPEEKIYIYFKSFFIIKNKEIEISFRLL